MENKVYTVDDETKLYTKYIQGKFMSYEVGNEKIYTNKKYVPFLYGLLFLGMFLLMLFQSYIKILLLFVSFVGIISYLIIDDVKKGKYTNEVEVDIIGYKKHENKTGKLLDAIYYPVYLLKYEYREYVLFSKKKEQVSPAVGTKTKIKIHETNPLKFYDGGTNTEYIKLLSFGGFVLVFLLFFAK